MTERTAIGRITLDDRVVWEGAVTVWEYHGVEEAIFPKRVQQGFAYRYFWEPEFPESSQ